MVNSDDRGDSIFLDFDRKMGKEKRYETTITQKLIESTFEAKEDEGSGLFYSVTVE